QVGTGAASAVSNITDDLSAANELFIMHGKARKMTVKGCDAVSMIDDHRAAITLHKFRQPYLPIRRSDDGMTNFGRDGDSGMEGAFSMEGINALAEGVRNASFYRPEIGCGR